MNSSEVQADTERKVSVYNKVKYADPEDVVFTVETVAGLQQISDPLKQEQFLYREAGYPDYAGKYNVQITRENMGFLYWDERSDKLAENHYKWERILKDEPYLSTWYSQSGTIPSLPIASNRLFATRKHDYLDAERRAQLYRAFISDMELNRVPKIQRIASLEGYRAVLVRKAGLLIDKMLELDEQAKNVLKVFFHETYQNIKGNGKAISELFDTMQQAYNLHFLKFCFSTADYGKILSSEEIESFIPAEIMQSATNGMKHLVTEKEPLVIELANLYEGMLFTEYAINDILKGEDEFMFKIPSTLDEEAQKKAIDKVSQKYKRVAPLFFADYIQNRGTYEELSIEKTCDTILSKNPELNAVFEANGVKNPCATLRTWVRNFTKTYREQQRKYQGG